jgi:hypothetical protein
METNPRIPHPPLGSVVGRIHTLKVSITCPEMGGMNSQERNRSPLATTELKKDKRWKVKLRAD